MRKFTYNEILKDKDGYTLFAFRFGRFWIRNEDFTKMDGNVLLVEDDSKLIPEETELEVVEEAKGERINIKVKIEYSNLITRTSISFVPDKRKKSDYSYLKDLTDRINSMLEKVRDIESA